MDARERDPLGNLEALARATDDLRPTDDLTEAVMTPLEAPSDVLFRVARETSDLAPSEDFASAVMRAVHEPSEARKTEPAWSLGVVRFGRVALIGAAAAAVLSLWLSQRAESVYDSAVLEAVAAIEVDE